MSIRSRAFDLHHRRLGVQDDADRIPLRGCKRGVQAYEVGQNSDVPNNQGCVQHGHGNDHRDNETGNQSQNRVGVRERHDSQTDIL